MITIDRAIGVRILGRMQKEALRTGIIRVYSSKEITLGIFVSASKMDAGSYSEDGSVFSKDVSIRDVAWIDALQGQYAPLFE